MDKSTLPPTTENLFNLIEWMNGGVEEKMKEIEAMIPHVREHLLPGHVEALENLKKAADSLCDRLTEFTIYSDPTLHT